MMPLQLSFLFLVCTLTKVGERVGLPALTCQSDQLVSESQRCFGYVCSEPRASNTLSMSSTMELNPWDGGAFTRTVYMKYLVKGLVRWFGG